MDNQIKIKDPLDTNEKFNLKCIVSLLIIKCLVSVWILEFREREIKKKKKKSGVRIVRVK